MPALTMTERYACSETYADVEKLIASTAWQFVRRYGGDVEELIADGNSHFMRAYLAPSFDPAKSKFSTWVRNVVWRGLCSDAHHRQNVVQLPESLPARESREWPRNEWLASLSEEAVTVVKLVLDMPEKLADAVDKKGEEPTPGAIKSALKSYLRGLGWATHSIASAFEEIGKAL